MRAVDRVAEPVAAECEASPWLRGLPPVIGPHTRLVVLGSFPGAASLAAGQYYAHPRNQFWPLLSALWALDLRAMDYAARLAEVRQRGLGLWDVYAGCRREGSLDADIREAKPNDLERLMRHATGLRAVDNNGGESARWHRAVAALGLQVERLPSSSPANASWGFERKLHAWRGVFQRHGLLADA